MISERPIIHPEQAYRDGLQSVGEFFSVDLSRSLEVPYEQVVFVRQLAEQYILWMQHRGYKTEEQTNQLLSWVENYLVFEEDEHREFRLAVKRKKVEIVESLDPNLAFIQRQELGSFERNKVVPPGNIIHFWDNQGKSFPIITLTALPYSDRTPHGYLPIEGVVAEETMHAASTIQKIEPYPISLLGYVEETGVKYYGVEAMRDKGINDEATAIYEAFGSQQLRVWEEYVNRVGTDVAGATFFQGAVSDFDKMTLYECIR